MTFLFKDENRAAFENGANKLFKENDLPDMKVNSKGMMNYPKDDNEFTVYVTTDPVEVKILQQAEKDKHFNFPFKHINMKEIHETAKLDYARSRANKTI